MNAEALREWRNYSFWLVRGPRAVQGLASLVRGIFHFIYWRRWPQRPRRPPYLAMAHRFPIEALRLRIPSHLPLRLDPNGLPLISAPIELAGRPCQFALGPKMWPVSFGDPEELLALHRFGWALCLLAERPTVSSAIFIQQAMALWIDEASQQPRQAAVWDSYSLSERLANWSLILWLLEPQGLLRDEKWLQKITRSLKEQACLLLERPEYHGPVFTNNHFLNNGRALYIFGSLFGSPAAKEFGWCILREEYERMFVDGFLREGSSHYHLLLCRSYLEVLLTAKAFGDQEVFEFLEAPVRAMLDASEMILTGAHGGKVPLIGDVSPDFKPSWAAGVTAVGNKIFGGSWAVPSMLPDGWHALWLDREAPVNDSRPPSLIWIKKPKAGWYRYDNQAWSLICYANPAGHVGHGSHGHCDTGSFELRWRGIPILVDSGRKAYNGASTGRDYVCGRAHNTVIVDKNDPIPCNHHTLVPALVSGAYLHQPPKVLIDEASEGFLQMHFSCYERLDPPVSLTRKFFVNAESVGILDVAQGKGRRTLESFFHFHPAVQIVDLENGHWRIQIPHGPAFRFSLRHQSLVVAGNEGGKRQNGYFSPQYGKEEKTEVIYFKYQGLLPYSADYSMEPM